MGLLSAAMARTAHPLAGRRLELRSIARRGWEVVLVASVVGVLTGLGVSLLDTVVLGISKDSVKSHERFCAKHDLGIPLLSDETGEVVARYGSWVEKSNYGRSYMGIDRSTFLIDADGRIARVWRNVKVPGHVDKVLEAAKAL